MNLINQILWQNLWFSIVLFRTRIFHISRLLRDWWHVGQSAVRYFLWNGRCNLCSISWHRKVSYTCRYLGAFFCFPNQL